MNWTDPQPPTTNVGYNHVKLSTPLGEILITWKGWKERPDYGIEFESEWIGVEYDLESAKNRAIEYLKTKYEELGKLLFGESSDTVEFSSVGKLRNALAGLPADRMIACEVVAKDGKAWSMCGEFCPRVPMGTIACLTLRNNKLETLP